VVEPVKVVELAARVDVARKAFYDRNPAVKICEALGWIEAGTTQWLELDRYTVPAGRKAIQTLIFDSLVYAIATSGQIVETRRRYTKDEVTWHKYSHFSHYSTVDPIKSETVTAEMMLMPGDTITIEGKNTDTRRHWVSSASLLVEFDE